jgi:hypothetical protein
VNGHGAGLAYWRQVLPEPEAKSGRAHCRLDLDQPASNTRPYKYRPWGEAGCGRAEAQALDRVKAVRTTSTQGELSVTSSPPDFLSRDALERSLRQSFSAGAVWPINRPAMAALLDMGLSVDEIARYFAVVRSDVSALRARYGL